MATPLYDAFSADYDRFVDWDGRLAYELPFIEEQLAAVGARRVLDVACGTGVHALALADRGYQVAGADLSTGMIERARENAADRGHDVRFAVAGFGELEAELGTGFDALLCLGNSLPHLLTTDELRWALADFAAVLRSGGLLLIQNRNFDAVLNGRTRWMPPQAHSEGSQEWLFLRFYDFNPDATLTFNVVTLRRADGGEWGQAIETARLRPWRSATLTQMTSAAGFGTISCYGDMVGSPFDPGESGNIVLSAIRD